MSIPNKVIDIPINNGDNHICPDDNIRIIYQKIIDQYYSSKPILEKHLFVWFLDGKKQIVPLGFNYMMSKKIKMNNPSDINIDPKFIDSAGEFLINEFSEYMDMTLQDYYLKYNDKVDLKDGDNVIPEKFNIHCVDIFSVIRTIKGKPPSKSIDEKRLFNGFFRKYWKFLDDSDISLLNGYDKLNKEIREEITKSYKLNNHNLQKIIQITHNINKVPENDKGDVNKIEIEIDGKVNLLKIDIVNSKLKANKSLINLVNLFINFKLTEECPFMKLHINKNIHVKIRRDNLEIYKGMDNNAYINRDLIENKWIKSYYSKHNYGGMGTFLKMSDTLQFKIIYNKDDRAIHPLLYTIVIHSNGHINIIVDDTEIKKLQNTRNINDYQDYIEKGVIYVKEKILRIINNKKTIINKKDIIIDKNIEYNEDIINPRKMDFLSSNITLDINTSEIFGSVSESKTYLDDILQCAFPYIRYIDPREIKNQIKIVEKYPTIYCKWKRVSHYDSDALRWAIIIKKLEMGMRPEDIKKYMAEQFNITIQSASKSYTECENLPDDKKDNYKRNREVGGIDIKINARGSHIVLTLEHIRYISDYYNLVSFFKRILQIYKDKQYHTICDRKHKSPKKQGVVKTHRKSKSKSKSKSPPKSPPKQKSKSPPKPPPKPISDDPDSDGSFLSDESSDDLLGGSGGMDYNISGYYISRLKQYNKEAYGFKPIKGTAHDKSYSQLCQLKRQTPKWYYAHPIVINAREKHKIDTNRESNPPDLLPNSSYANFKTDDKGNNYIAPEFWDIDKEISIPRESIYPDLKATEEEIEECKNDDKIKMYIDKYPEIVKKFKKEMDINKYKFTSTILLNIIDKNTPDMKNVLLNILEDILIIERLKTMKELNKSFSLVPSDKYKDKLIPWAYNKGKTDKTILQRLDYNMILNTDIDKIRARASIREISEKKHPDDIKMYCSGISDDYERARGYACPIGTECRLIKEMSDFFEQDPGYDKTYDPKTGFYYRKGIEQSRDKSLITCISHIIDNEVFKSEDKGHISFSEGNISPEAYSVLSNGLLVSNFIDNKYDIKEVIHDINHKKSWKEYRPHLDNPENMPYLVKLYNSYYKYLDLFLKDTMHFKDDIYLIGLLEHYISYNMERNISIIIFEIINGNIVKIRNPLKGTTITKNDEYIYILKKDEIYEPIFYKKKYIKQKNHKKHHKKNTYIYIHLVSKTENILKSPI